VAAGVTDAGDNTQKKGGQGDSDEPGDVKIDKQVGKKRTVDAMSVIAGGWGGGGVDTEEVDEEARANIVQSRFN
jgi:hypothetical protein